MSHAARDLIEIATVQNTYAVAIDTRDWVLLERCFSPDAQIRYGRPARTTGRAEFVTWAPEFHDPLGPTLHQNSSHRAIVDGDHATGSCYLHAVLVSADETRAESVYGAYTDEFTRGTDGWQISRRSFRAAWLTSTTRPAPPA
jgi:hypothetical protein